jgi:PAS domain S-box-containing protein
MLRVRRWLLDLSLAGKLTFFSTATSALSTAVVCAILGWYTASEMRARLILETAHILNSLAATSAGTLLFLDDQVALDAARRLARDDQTLTVALWLPNGQTLARYDRPGAPDTARNLPIDGPSAKKGEGRSSYDGRTLDMTQPVWLDGSVVGAIYIRRSLSDLRAGTIRLWWTVGYAWAGMNLVAALLAWWLQRMVSRPILSLASVVREVVHKHDLTIRATKGGDDEIGDLVDRVNDLLAEVQRHEGVVADYQRNLEEMVGTRTAELNAKNERYRMLLESTRAVPWEIDARTFTTTYIAPQITSVTGHDPSNVIGRSGWELIHPQDRDRLKHALFGAVSDPAQEIDLEHRWLTTGPASRLVHTIATLCRNEPDGVPILRGISVDVTDQRRLEMELRQSQKLESVGRLAAGVAHEINTPIQFVTDSVHFLREAVTDIARLVRTYRAYCAEVFEAPNGSQKGAELRELEDEADVDYLLDNMPKALERSLDGLSRVAAIVRSMKEFAHPDQHEMAAVDLNQGIRSTLTIARNEYKYVADVETHFDDLPRVTCHASDINQVVLNILVNAAHAIEDKVHGSANRGRITVQTRRDGDFAVITIADTGSGIPDDIRERIFDPFFTTKEVGRGTGQGLAIARSMIIEKHHGSLTFKSEAGIGTEFTIRLPIVGWKAAA